MTVLDGRLDPTDRTAMLAAVDRARRAPSVHNTQPWIFHITATGVDVLSDSSRQLSTLDPAGRELAISCGAAVLHLKIALQAKGYRPQVSLLPDRGRTDIVARITPGARGMPDQHSAVLDSCADQRHTNRRAYHGALTATETSVLQTAAAAEAAGLQPVLDAEDRVALKVLQQAADAAQQSDPAYHDELRRWVGPEVRDDGIPLAATTEQVGQRHDFASRDFADHRDGGFPEQPDDPETAVFLLYTQTETQRAWLQAGQALARIWLEATRLGLVLQPLSQSVEDPTTRAELRRSLRLLNCSPQLVLRVGHAQPQGPTPRRATGDVLVLDPVADRSADDTGDPTKRHESQGVIGFVSAQARESR